MLTLSDIQDKLVDLTDTTNLGAERTRSWVNMVSCEFAARMAGSDLTGMAVVGTAVWTAAVSWTSSSASYPAWVGSWVQSGLLTASAEYLTLTTNTGMVWPQDVLYLNRVFHAATSSTSLANASGTAGIYQQQYLRSEPGDLFRAAQGQVNTLSVASDSTASSIFYAGVGAAFISDTATWYGPQHVVWPNPQGATCFALLEYVPAPTSLSVTDTGKSNVWMSKYPEVFLAGVLRYAWLYLGNVENYLKAKKAWEDGLAKLAGVSRSFANQAVVGAQADHDQLRYMRG
jgi:hypothetical protein